MKNERKIENVDLVVRNGAEVKNGREVANAHDPENEGK